jgi:hypothetical protein
MTSVTERVKKILESTSENEQWRAMKFVPQTGNLYVYENARGASVGMIAMFIRILAIVTNTGTDHFVGCKLNFIDDDVITVRFINEGSEYYMTFDRSRIFILD